MQLQELYDIAHLFSTHQIITHISRLYDNVILLRLDKINYCIDLTKSNMQIYIAPNPLKNKEYQATFDIIMKKYLYKSA